MVSEPPLLLVLDLTGTFAFAVNGALTALRLARLDIVGVITLGIITAIACVADLNRRGVRLPFAIEVVGFADEEGVRFASTLLGSRAVAGTFDERVLNTRDADGLTMREAMTQFGLDPGHVGAAARTRRELHAYVELHIEQGPVLEQ